MFFKFRQLVTEFRIELARAKAAKQLSDIHREAGGLVLDRAWLDSKNGKQASDYAAFETRLNELRLRDRQINTDCQQQCRNLRLKNLAD
jgi:hypothetical protein